MKHNSFLRDQYLIQSNDSIRNSEQLSPIHASLDPRFSSLFVRAANHRERVSHQKVSPTNWVYSPSTVNSSSNAWSPAEASNEKLVDTQKKSCLSPAWKNRLQGLFGGLAVAAISIGVILGVLLTRSTTNCATSTSTSTSTTAPACSSLQWSETSVPVAGNGSYGNASYQFSDPCGIYVDSNYTIYVADYSNHRVQRWPLNAVTGTTVAGVTGIQGSNASLLSYPRSVYLNSQQNLYVADNNGISIWALGATVSNRVPGSSSIGYIYDIFIDTNGNLYASTVWNCAIQMWTPTATASTVVAGGNGCGPSSSQLYYAYDFTVNSQTNTIYAANSNVHTIVGWPVGGTSGTIVAGQNSTYGSIDFLLYYPIDVQSDLYGNLYVADAYNNRILLFCQNPPSTSASIIAGYQLSYPSIIALDSGLNLYVVNNNQVQKYTRIV